MNLADLRRNYTQGSLTRRDLKADPLEQFQNWLESAQRAAQAGHMLEPNAMTLATVDAEGQPAARIVLLKGLDERGFSFYTNYESRKAHELAANPKVALVFNWLALERQVRVEGTATKLPVAESEAYHKSRPHGSQLSEWASPQSQVVKNREVLEARLHDVEAEFPDDVPLPDFWGGFVVRPERLEFWQGRPNRLHDRFRYFRQGAEWGLERLAP